MFADRRSGTGSMKWSLAPPGLRLAPSRHPYPTRRSLFALKPAPRKGGQAVTLCELAGLRLLVYREFEHPDLGRGRGTHGVGHLLASAFDLFLGREHVLFRFPQGDADQLTLVAVEEQQLTAEALALL